MKNDQEELKQAIIDRMLRQHVGQENAATRESLVAAFDIPDRECRRVIEEIVIAGRLPIGGLPRPPFGYFVLSTKEEYEQVKADLLARIKMIGNRLDGLDAAWAERNGQERLFQRECLAEARRTLH